MKLSTYVSFSLSFSHYHTGGTNGFFALVVWGFSLIFSNRFISSGTSYGRDNQIHGVSL